MHKAFNEHCQEKVDDISFGFFWQKFFLSVTEKNTSQ